MVIDRLVALLDGIWDRRLGLIVAPPGAGKTTLLATALSTPGYPVAWYRADRWDDRPEALARRLGASFQALMSGDASRWSTMGEVASDLARWDPARAILAIDDFHAIAGSPAETAIEWLVGRMPAGLRVLIASRTQPDFNTSRMRVSGELLEVTADDLRFRTWEVERLFRQHYGEPLSPEDSAKLAQWTEGWAAGLQLFHLAAAGRPPDERRILLNSLGPRSRLAREYLGQNVLDRVGEELRRFMVESSVLSRLDPCVCDQLLARSDSARILEQLERRCLFTMRLDDRPSYRYHEVFRGYLQGVLIATVGEDEVRRRFREAAELYAAEGDIAASVEAYARAEAWDAVDRVLATDGGSIASSRPRWLYLAPPAHLKEDPWLVLAAARRLRAEGRFDEAIDAYASIIQGSETEAATTAALRERAILVALLAPTQEMGLEERADWWSLLRDGMVSDPRAVAERAAVLSRPESRLVMGLCLLLAGRIREALMALESLAEDRDAEGATACAAWLACGAASLLAGDQRGSDRVKGAIDSAERVGWEWMARIGRSTLALSGDPDDRREARRLRDAAAAVHDSWGLAFACLAEAWGSTLRPLSREDHEGCIDHDGEAVAVALAETEALGAPTLHVWAEALAALQCARRGASGRDERVRAAARRARSRRVDGAIQLTDLALAVTAEDADTCEQIARDLQDQLGLHVPVNGHGVGQPATALGRHLLVDEDVAEEPAVPPMEIRLLGPFRLAIEGREVDVGVLRPRVRSLLRFLALHAGEPVHREAIEETFWPGAPPESATRNLHVAIASLRRLLEPTMQRNGFRTIIREGETYTLLTPDGSRIDVRDFEAAVARLRSIQPKTDGWDTEHWCRMALAAFKGDLLPEEGPADWVVPLRESIRLEALDAASTLAKLLADHDEWDACASVCIEGLGHDRYHDGLWRTLIEAKEALGDRAAAISARASYGRVLEELEVATAQQS